MDFEEPQILDRTYEFEGAGGLIAAIKEKNTNQNLLNEASREYSFEISTSKIPDSCDRVADTVLGCLLNGAWHQRRVVMTCDVISFALVGKDEEIDFIPLAEVASLEEMGGSDEVQDQAASDSPARIFVGDRRFSTVSQSLIWPMQTKQAAADVELAASATAAQLFANALHLSTVEDGYNSGRSYYLQAESRERLKELLSQLQPLVAEARARHQSTSRFRRSQELVLALYSSRLFQTGAALLIVANFIVNLVEAQFSVDFALQQAQAGGVAPPLAQTLDICNLFFTAVFALELAVNAYAHWFEAFVYNAWSMLDAFVVLMSLVALGPVDLPMSILRIMRAFRVIRLFGRLKALRKMVSALTSSILPMMNAFLILFIIASIYAVMGVSLFADDSFEDFGRFSHAFISMFHLTSEGNWPPNLPAYEEDGSPRWLVSLFCISYVVLVNWVVLQVSVAVLLDSFVSASTNLDDAERRLVQEQNRNRLQTRSPLEPLLRKFCREFVDDADLSDRLRRLFQLLDVDGSGSLSRDEFCVAIKKLAFQPRIHIAASDFLSFTRGGALCSSSGMLGQTEFERAMREQLRMYTQRSVSLLWGWQGQLCSTEQRSRAEAEQTHLGALKWLLAENQRTRADLAALRDALVSTLPSSTGASPCMSPIATPRSASRNPVIQECSVGGGGGGGGGGGEIFALQHKDGSNGVRTLADVGMAVDVDVLPAPASTYSSVEVGRAQPALTRKASMPRVKATAQPDPLRHRAPAAAERPCALAVRVAAAVAAELRAEVTEPLRALRATVAAVAADLARVAAALARCAPRRRARPRAVAGGSAPRFRLPSAAGNKYAPPTPSDEESTSLALPTTSVFTRRRSPLPVVRAAVAATDTSEAAHGTDATWPGADGEFDPDPARRRRSRRSSAVTAENWVPYLRGGGGGGGGVRVEGGEPRVGARPASERRWGGGVAVEAAARPASVALELPKYPFSRLRASAC